MGLAHIISESDKLLQLGRREKLKVTMLGGVSTSTARRVTVAYKAEAIAGGGSLGTDPEYPKATNFAAIRRTLHLVLER